MLSLLHHLLPAAFLIFFEVVSGASGPAVERWQWTLVLAAALEGGRSPAVWLKPGGWVGKEGGKAAEQQGVGCGFEELGDPARGCYGW
jgi:hypothetical protein